MRFENNKHTTTLQRNNGDYEPQYIKFICLLRFYVVQDFQVLYNSDCVAIDWYGW